LFASLFQRSSSKAFAAFAAVGAERDDVVGLALGPGLAVDEVAIPRILGHLLQEAARLPLLGIDVRRLVDQVLEAARDTCSAPA
jgi:hypothetical protein